MVIGIQTALRESYKPGLALIDLLGRGDPWQMQLPTSADGYYADNPHIKNRLDKVHKQFRSRKKKLTIHERRKMFLLRNKKCTSTSYWRLISSFWGEEIIIIVNKIMLKKKRKENNCTYTEQNSFPSNLPERGPRLSYKFLNHAYMYYGGEADLYLHLNKSRKRSRRQCKYKSYCCQSFTDMSQTKQFIFIWPCNICITI